LSGVWPDWPSEPRAPIFTLPMSKLLAWGTGSGDVGLAGFDAAWSNVSRPKHKFIFDAAEHWDYLPADTQTCDVWRGAKVRGPCDFVGPLANEIVLAFFGKYLPPERWADLRERIPNSLLPVFPESTGERRFFDAGHPVRQSSIAEIGRHEHCRIDAGWTSISGESGSTRRD
jgi:hypothetical protein